jgi:enterobacteria phage integrase
MGRVRDRSRIRWPDNLYTCMNGFKYRHPVTRKDTWMGRDCAKAFEAARKLNAILIPSNDLVARVIEPTETIDDAIKVFRQEDVPGREWAQKTADLYENILDRMSAAIGKREVAGFAVRDCASFVKEVTESQRARQQFRLALQWVLACAVEEGWIETNPALQTRKANYKRARDRLTKGVYEAIHAKATSWLQNAMDLSLLTLLRREDIVSLCFADVHDNALWVVPGKTEGSTGVRLKIDIEPTGELAALITRCRDSIVSPFLIHRLPDRALSRDKRAKTRAHHTQVLPEQLSRAFAEARDEAGVEGDNPPTFHEIRSLGGALLRDAGWTKAQVQELMTHTSESMTQHYLEGHEAPWTEVRTGIALNTIGKK